MGPKKASPKPVSSHHSAHMNALNQQMKHDAKMNTMRQQSLAAQSKALEQSMAKEQTDLVKQRRVQADANARAQPEVYKTRQIQQQSWDKAVAISNASRHPNSVNPQNPMGSHSYYGDNYKHHYNNNLKQLVANYRFNNGGIMERGLL